jgi:hypothetical protein
MKRTKIETTERQELVLGGMRYFATIKEIFVDSGKTKRVLCKLDAATKQELYWQLDGAMKGILAMREKRTSSE